jgi:hypothetical protein
MKKWLVLGMCFLCLILLLAFVACNINGNCSIFQKEDNVVLKVGFFENPGDMYYYTLTQNGILEASYGVISPDYVFGDDLINMLGEVKKSDTIQLTKAELANLLEMADEIEKNADNPEWEYRTIFGGWDVYLNYNDVYYELNYTRAPAKVIKCLANQLYMLLPIQESDFFQEIVEDLRKDGYTIDNRWKEDK